MAAAPRIRQAQVVLGERQLSFTLYRVPRRRHVHVLVNENGDLVVRAPWRCSLTDARLAISEHGDWVLAQIECQRSHLRLRPRLVPGCRLPLLNVSLELRFHNSLQHELFSRSPEAGGGRVYRKGRYLWVVLRALQDVQRVPGLLEAWYRRQAGEILPRRMQPLARQLGVQYRRISIRAQRTRWGSCSATGAISLNWRLMLLSESLCDYVLVHELSHLREMNHSPRFWSLVGGVIPDFQSRRRQLRQLSQPLAL